VVAPKFGGWTEKLYLNATGDVVTAGQKLFAIYSPELNVLQQEFALSRNMQGPAGAADRSRESALRRAAAAHHRRCCAGGLLRRRLEQLSRKWPRTECATSPARCCPRRRHLNNMGSSGSLRAEPCRREGGRHGQGHHQYLARPVFPRPRPKMMTVTAIAGLLPILWNEGTGSEVMQRIAVPMIGGMASSTLLALLVIPGF